MLVNLGCLPIGGPVARSARFQAAFYCGDSDEI
jgi:hypothetical protein